MCTKNIEIKLWEGNGVWQVRGIMVLLLLLLFFGGEGGAGQIVPIVNWVYQSAERVDHKLCVTCPKIGLRILIKAHAHMYWGLWRNNCDKTTCRTSRLTVFPFVEVMSLIIVAVILIMIRVAHQTTRCSLAGHFFFLCASKGRGKDRQDLLACRTAITAYNTSACAGSTWQDRAGSTWSTLW